MFGFLVLFWPLIYLWCRNDYQNNSKILKFCFCNRYSKKKKKHILYLQSEIDSVIIFCCNRMSLHNSCSVIGEFGLSEGSLGFFLRSGVLDWQELYSLECFQRMHLQTSHVFLAFFSALTLTHCKFCSVFGALNFQNPAFGSALVHASTKIPCFLYVWCTHLPQKLLFQCTHLQKCHGVQCFQRTHLQISHILQYFGFYKIATFFSPLFSRAFGAWDTQPRALVQNKIQKIHLGVTDKEINFGNPSENDRYRK